MDSVPNPPPRVETLRVYMRRILSSCLSFLPCFKRQHQVHPIGSDSENSKYFQLNAHRRVHVLHIDTQKMVANIAAQKLPHLSRNSDVNELSRSLSISSNKSDRSTGEYWFTRWNRPLNLLDNCNCSFRRHCRKPIQNNKPPILSQAHDKVHYDKHTNILKLPIKSSQSRGKSQVILSSNIEIFAEDFIKRILCDALSHLSLRSEDINNKQDFCNSSTHKQMLNAIDNTSHSQILNSCSMKTNTQSPSSSSDVFHEKSAPPTQSKVKSVKKRKLTVMNANTGCVNPTFLISPSDPGAAIIAKRSCKHVKRVTKPVLYFLHGVGSSAQVWSSQLQFFVAAGYEVVAPDMLGHGSSAAPDKSSAYTFQCILKDAVDIFDRFVGEHGKCVVIGHGYGCSLAAAVARYRTQVTQLVLISGGGPTPLAPTYEASLFPCLQWCMKPFVVCGFKRDALYPSCGKHMVPCEALSVGMPKHILRYMAMGQDWPEGDSTFHRRILVPTLLVHGMQDPHVTLVQECEMERTIPRSFLELIPNAGHQAMLETPAQLSHMIHCFIDWWAR